LGGRLCVVQSALQDGLDEIRQRAIVLLRGPFGLGQKVRVNSKGDELFQEPVAAKIPVDTL
jgi:hypothetical protein